MAQEIEKISHIGSNDKNNDDSQFLQQSTSFFTLIEDNKELAPEDVYENDEDPGFELFEVEEHDFSKVCRHLANEYGYPDKVVKRDNKNSSKNRDNEKKKRNDSDCDNSRITLEEEKDN